MNIKQLLENRHTAKLRWFEPWPSIGPEGNKLTAHIELRASVHDCINLSRKVAKEHNQPTISNDDKFLEEFIAIHWAEEVE